MTDPVTPSLVSPPAALPAGSGESTGAASAPLAAPVASPTSAAPAAPAATPTPVSPTPAPTEAPAATPEPAREFAPSLFEAQPGEPTPPAAPVTPAPATAPTDPAAPAVPGPEAPAAEPPAAVAEPAPPPEPIAYEFTFPETVDASAVDKPAMDRYTEILNKARVPQEVAQEALDLYLKQVQSIGKRLADNQWDVFNRQQEAWQNRALADPEVGGARFKTAQRNAARYIEGMGFSPAEQKVIMDVMRTTGAGNHPLIYKLFARTGERFFKEGEARNMPPARQAPLTREQKQAARYK